MLGGNIPLDGAITNPCEREEAAKIERSHTLLQKMGVTLKDLKDVKHTHDGWLHYIDECLPRFQHRLGFNTACCPIRNNSLRSRGNWGIPRSTPDIWSTEIDHLYLGSEFP
ncbi:hypothetical protein A2U01_0025004 [Trifolium medium]|uniref:Uncharacterized protein n=1 Tax=Trifolium medium TaxID=97028 RepID=A0A392NVX2_9FABA|nr:hypothetical protein [Trifolium medium]